MQQQIIGDVEAAIRAGDLPRAVEMARAALARGMVHPLLLNLRAYWLEENNRQKEALADLQHAVSLAPGDVLIRNAYGLCLTKLERWADAVAVFEIAVTLQPDFAPSHFNLGWTRERVGDLDGAKSEFERAYALMPENAEPLSRLASLAARRADWENARTLAEKALAADPRQYLALTTLADVAVGQRDFERADGLLAQIFADPSLPPFYHAMAQSILGDLRHGQGRYGEAFEAYAKGNAERRGMFAHLYAGPGVETASGYAQWLIEYFESADKSQWTASGKAAPAGPAVSSHVFLVGFPRSGTTLLENVLGANPGIVSLEEKEVLIDAVRDFLTKAEGRDRLAAIGDSALNFYRQSYWRRVSGYCGDVTGKVFVDKQPLSSMKLPVIAKLFPTAKILFAIRDPRDVVLSCFRRQFLLNPSMYEFLDFEGAAKFYAAVMRLSMIYREKFDLAWHELRHEALIDDFEGEARKACDFIGATWDESMADFAERARKRPIATPSSVQVMRGLNREGVGQWRNYRAQMAPIMPILQPWIEKFGYPPD